MNAFRYRRGELHCEGVALRRLAEEFGTPVYVYSQGHITGQYDDLHRALRSIDHLICFAVKANSNLAVLRALARAGTGFDIVSGGELYRVAQAGGDPRRCVFSGVGKSRDEIEYALKLGIYIFNVESEPELRRIATVARRMGRRAPIAIRVNPGVDPDTHHYISTGKHESKFGISIRDALDVYRAAAGMDGIEIRGVQMHIGSQITKTAPFVLAIRKITPLIERVRQIAPRTLQSFDVGGGVGILYRSEHPPTAAEYARAVIPHVKSLGLRILLEPGRFIVGNGGALVTRVVYVKRTPVKRFVIVDAAMNDLIRPALYGSYHEIVPVSARDARRKITADVVGPVCESGDFLAQGRRLAAVEEGALLTVMSAGAYGMSMASNYNARPRLAEVMVSGSRYELVRRRESVKDLISGETIPRWLV
ncbi:MAG TPA: diaminopimelate decarboxylase [Verrucomicrobiae bacterium]|nr:diaminopimelate decarboxylase [Verrucomicrobiae bacterium]